MKVEEPLGLFRVEPETVVPEDDELGVVQLAQDGKQLLLLDAAQFLAREAVLQKRSDALLTLVGQGPRGLKRSLLEEIDELLRAHLLLEHLPVQML